MDAQTGIEFSCMVTLHPNQRKTTKDFLALPEGTRAELIDGEILMSPSPRFRHQRVAFRLARMLAEYVESNGLGEVIPAPFDVHLPGGDIVEPDVVFVSAANRSMLRDWIHGTPDLVVEVHSPDSMERDRVTKRELYARNGVREYWMVDSDRRVIEVLTLQANAYALAGQFGVHDTLSSRTFPKLALSVKDVFA